MRAQVDMKIVYLALSLVMLGIFIQVIWPMVTGAQKTAEIEQCKSEISMDTDLNGDGLCTCDTLKGLMGTSVDPEKLPAQCR